ncbi:MAG: hypothetical protein IPQ07_44190 [Myxococcales bacterium]|nr:hypothetical protein [Myxococcales bacterium]
MEIRDQTAHIVTTRNAFSRTPEDGIVWMDDMLRAYLDDGARAAAVPLHFARIYPAARRAGDDAARGPGARQLPRPAISNETGSSSRFEAALAVEVRAKDPRLRDH